MKENGDLEGQEVLVEDYPSGRTVAVIDHDGRLVFWRYSKNDNGRWWLSRYDKKFALGKEAIPVILRMLSDT